MNLARVLFVVSGVAEEVPPEGYQQLRGWLVHHHLLWDDEGVYLIDGGFLGGVTRVEEALNAVGRTWADVRAILLTNGRLGHTLNVSALREKAGCQVFAPLSDRDHLFGEARYGKLSRIAGLAEQIGRWASSYEVPFVDHWFVPDEPLPFWGGLRVIALPGHTMGHCGFYSRDRRLLFSGDLFTNYWGLVKRPLPWFNANSRMIQRSIVRALDLELEGVLPNHCRVGSPASHLADLEGLGRRLQK